MIEMIVVIAVLALAGALVIARQPMRSGRVNLEAATRTVSGALRLARSQAILRGTNVWVVSGAEAVAIRGGPSWRLPSDVSITATEVAFGAAGDSSGATIMLSGGGRREAVDVDWLTGRVIVSGQR